MCDISWYRGTDVESWITSDGRAYFVQLSESAYSDVNMSNPDVNGEDSLPVRLLLSIDSFRILTPKANRTRSAANITPEAPSTAPTPIHNPHQSGMEHVYTISRFRNGFRSSVPPILKMKVVWAQVGVGVVER